MAYKRRTVLAFSFLCAACLTPISVLGATPSAEDVLGQKWADGWNSGDADGFSALFSGDASYQDVPFGVNAQGTDQIRGLYKQFREAATGFHIKLLSAHVSRGYGTFEWIMMGTDAAVFKTGKPFEVRGASVVKVRNGKIGSIRDYYDAATIMRQVGALLTADTAK